MKAFLTRSVLAMIALLSSMATVAGESYKPFVLAYRASGSLESATAEVRNKLTAGGFEVVGSYSPYPTTQVVIVTDGDLKQNAAQSKFGGYGIAQRVAVSKVGEDIQVSYTNPVYMAYAYRMAGDLKGVADHLAKVLGRMEEFGPDAGLDASKLRKYHYMFGMEYFDDPSVLAEYDSYEAAVKAVEQGLAKNTVGASKVYRIDVPGKQETVFGVGLRSEKNKYQDDGYIMSEIDFKPIRSSAHLPYEMLVSGNKVYALYARFRIAINFPDLSMMGDHSFMNIMGTPDAIKNALTLTAGGKVKGPLD